MQVLTRAQKARRAIREFKTITDALAIRGSYRTSGKFGKSLEAALQNLSPEIYGSMNDPRVVELKGLEYVIDRLPRGIEDCTRLILTEEDPGEKPAFEKIVPLKRRRTSYRVSEKEMCFVVSRGLSEIYDILTHITFLNIEAQKIHRKIKDDSGNTTIEWNELKKVAESDLDWNSRNLDQAIWNLSIVLGRPYQETRRTYEYLEKNKNEHNSNNGLFSIIFRLGQRIEEEILSWENALVIYLAPSLMDTIGHQKYGKKWAENIKERLLDLKFQDRPIHIISANLHSVVNLLYSHAAWKGDHPEDDESDLYDLVSRVRDAKDDVFQYATRHGLIEIPDQSGTNIDCQLIDTSKLESVMFHPSLKIGPFSEEREKPVILVMDYAFGAQAFELMENLLNPYSRNGSSVTFNFRSISIMGKAGILPGAKGDIMLATAHVLEGTSDNYIFENQLTQKDFTDDVHVYTGPMVTVLGTSLQNRDVLEKFQSDWKTVGLEMEGGHYQRAINAAIIKGNISKDIPIRYAYYASDNPLMTGHTLAAGEMGQDGIKPTYMITKIILEKILWPQPLGEAGRTISIKEQTGSITQGAF